MDWASKICLWGSILCLAKTGRATRIPCGSWPDKPGSGFISLKPVSSREAVVSSTRIRQFVQAGKMEQAMQYLGRPYSLKGTVIEGERRGQGLGYRTANLRPDKDRVLPPDGVYATKMVWQDAVFPAVSYIGTRPTFGEGERLLEVHVLDGVCELYGQAIEVQFLQYIRGDERFDDSGRLAERIAQDVQQTRRVFAA